MDSYLVKPRIYMDRDGLTEILQGRKKAFIVTDRFMHESGKVSYITDICARMGVEVTIFSEIKPDPDIATVTKGISMMVDIKPDVLFALGGGSSIDAAKAMNYLASREGMLEKAYFVAIPTTSGTGSEVTSFAVVNDTEAHVKYPLISDSLTADEAILDAKLVASVPPTITADTGMDVVTHALESYVSTQHNEFSAALAEKALEICSVFLTRCYYDGNDMHARQKMHVASCLAGLAFNTASLGINHSMAHQLGARFHIPHGRANAMLLPHVIEFNSDINHASRSQKEYLPAVERYASAAHVLGLSSYNPVMGVRSLVNWTQFMMKEMAIPMRISELKTISAVEYFDALDEMSENALKDGCTATNPRPVTKEQIKHIYTKLW